MVEYIRLLKNENFEKFRDLNIDEKKEIIMPGLSQIGKIYNINIVIL